MEAWRDELYHYGVKGMKWRKRKNQMSEAEKQARIDEGARRAHDEAQQAKKEAFDKYYKEYNKYSYAQKRYEKTKTGGNRRAANAAKRKNDDARHEYDMAEKNYKHAYNKAFNNKKKDRKALSDYRNKKQSPKAFLRKLFSGKSRVQTRKDPKTGVLYSKYVPKKKKKKK